MSFVFIRESNLNFLRPVFRVNYLFRAMKYKLSTEICMTSTSAAETFLFVQKAL